MHKTITKEEINQLPQLMFTGNIHIITDTKQAIKACLKLSSEKELGFDTETKPCFKKGDENLVSLLQLSSETDAYLFRILQFDIPNELVQILENKEIIKTGVAIRDDINGLNKVFKFAAGSFIEIAELAKAQKIDKLGLRSLAAILLNKRVTKGAKLSNWEAPELKKNQLHYAATDAWASLKIYQAINQKK